MSGLGEAGFVPGGTAMISASYPKEKRGWAMGIFHIAIPLGAAAGVMLGGIISVKIRLANPFPFLCHPRRDPGHPGILHEGLQNR